MSWDNVGPNACHMDGTPMLPAGSPRHQGATQQDTAAAERSAHVTRSGYEPAEVIASRGPLLREVAPGRYQLAAVADAYRAGISAAAVELRRQAREMRRTAGRCPVALSNASALEIAADSLAELPAAYEPSGLEYRGG